MDSLCVRKLFFSLQVYFQHVQMCLAVCGVICLCHLGPMSVCVSFGLKGWSPRCDFKFKFTQVCSSYYYSSVIATAYVYVVVLLLLLTYYGTPPLPHHHPQSLLLYPFLLNSGRCPKAVLLAPGVQLQTATTCILRVLYYRLNIDFSGLSPEPISARASISQLVRVTKILGGPVPDCGLILGDRKGITIYFK
ncbi:hypothetical protein DFH29DRAFT_648372 [Suillus ampliporus]|nr:hypothetical protein DFH29DRAFT_648372 [Suillus ampliporus]